MNIITILISNNLIIHLLFFIRISLLKIAVINTISNIIHANISFILNELLIILNKLIFLLNKKKKYYILYIL